MKKISVQLVKVDYSVEDSFFKSSRTEIALIKMAIVRFHIGATEWEIEEELEKHGMRPAEYAELMSMKEFPTIKDEYTVFASGSEITSGLSAGCFPLIIVENGNVIERDYNRFGNDLGQPYFAAVYERR